MKIKYSGILLLFLLFFVVSCKKEKNTPKSTTSTTGNSFFLKKDNVGFSPGYIEVSDPFEYAVSIAAAANPQSNANVYSFLIDKNIPVGSYDYETMIEEYNCWFSYSTPNFDLCYINDGTFEIIQQDTTQKILEMKFQFEMEDSNAQTYQVTEGAFKVHY